MSSNDFTPPPAVEQIQAPRQQSKGINVPTFIISLVLVAAIAGGAGWFVGNTGGYSRAQSDFRDNPVSFVQSAGGGFGGFGAGGAGRNGGAAGTGQNANGTPVAGRGAGNGARGFGGGEQGKITAINGSTITIETADKTFTVNTTSSTRVAGVTTMTIGDLKVGDRVTVAGPTNGDTITANSVISGSLNSVFGGFGGPGGAGTGTGTGTGTGNGSAPAQNP